MVHVYCFKEVFSDKAAEGFIVVMYSWLIVFKKYFVILLICLGFSYYIINKWTFIWNKCVLNEKRDLCSEDKV